MTVFAKEAKGQRYMLVNRAFEELWGVSRHEVIGLTAGASTPGELVDATIERLAALGYDEVVEVTVAREDVHFRLPREVASA